MSRATSVSTHAQNLAEQLRVLEDRAHRVQQSLRQAEKRARASHMISSTPGQRQSARILMVLHAGEPTVAVRFLSLRSKTSIPLDWQKEGEAHAYIVAELHSA